MKRRVFKNIIFFVCLLLTTLCFGFWTNPHTKESSELNDYSNDIIGKNFVIYDGMMYKKPDLSNYGLRKINVIYEDSLLDRGVINYKKLDREINRVKSNNAPICLDIESWDLRGKNYKQTGQKYIEVLNYFKKRLPGRKIGYFGMLPYRDLYLYNYKSVGNNIKKNNYLDQWQTMNSNLRFITKYQNLAFPSFYTRNKNMDLWTWAASQQIKKLKEIDPNVPVYGFVWPQYWNKEFMSAEDWAYQLETLYKICDGIVIWSPPFNIDNRKAIQWDSQREWWKETLKFIKRHNIS
ncbi:MULTISPECIES: hypothetical protein [Sphingobacterium]|uniref:hypothetical protein n=1 Tax=Sphingobacterium TaxID=28453 RepID=UPI00257E3CC9|nr:MULTISPECIES: hypothetical protein [Sphingobacterium]